jgi:signal transduction histidine kinase/ActR/RegA family two-component response regulator
MKEILNKVIDKHITDPEDFAFISKVAFIYVFSSIGVSVTTIIGLKNMAIGNYMIGSIELSVSFIQIMNLLYFRRSNNLYFSANLLNFLFYLLLVSLFLMGGLENTGIYWVTLFPVVVYFIDTKLANRWIATTVVTLIAFALLKKFTDIALPYSFVEYRQSLIAFISMSAMIYYYHHIIIQQREALSQRRREAQDLALKAKASSQAKSEFLANMSHEIRTPLNAMLGFLDILKAEDHGRKSLQYVEIIDKSSQSLLQIIEDILDFSKIESGKLNIDPIDFNPALEFKMITDLFEHHSQQKNISLNIHMDSNLPLLIKSDPLRIKQVIANLLSNAIKFTDENKTIDLTIRYGERKLFISITDEGKGIEPDKLEHIFEAFNQEDNTTTRVYGGTGLGLTISKRLVELLGGQMRVKSQLGQGSEFYFEIPVEVIQLHPTVEPASQSVEYVQKERTFKDVPVLVVEDNRSNQMLIQLMLKKMGLHSSKIADNGLEAVEMIKLKKYQVILMDENMPIMDGIEATQRILAYEKEQNIEHTPIIALTANALKGDKERLLQAGVDEYLTKPINKHRLALILDKYIESA